MSIRKKLKSLPLVPDDYVAPGDRSCGDCQFCCEAIAVHELGKPYRAVCVHQCPSGCDVYKTRPPSCRGFRCTWLTGSGPVGHRPDKFGIMFGVFEDPKRGEGWWLDAFEVRAGVWVTEDGSDLRGVPGLDRALFDIYEMFAEVGQRIQGIRVYPHGLPVPALFDPKPPYVGPSSAYGRQFRVIKDDPVIGRLMIYTGMWDRNAPRS